MNQAPPKISESPQDGAALTKFPKGVLYESRDSKGMRYAVSSKGHLLEGRKQIEKFFLMRKKVQVSWEDFCSLRDRFVSARVERQKIAAEEEIRKRPVSCAFFQSDGTFTRQVLKRLESLGSKGKIAAQLFRIQKASTMAKAYRGDYKGLAYGRKGQSIEVLCQMLGDWELKWGWGRDNNEFAPEHVLYVELPQGQVSFHSEERFSGPDFHGAWDGQRLSKERIIEFCETILRESDTQSSSAITSVPQTR
jgi:hypothetical protein